jgi:hypothetical protein
MTGKHDDLEVGLVLLDRFEEFHTVHVGQPDVEDADIEGLFLHQGKGVARRGRDGHRESFAGKLLLEGLNKLFLIVDDQYPDHSQASSAAAYLA